MKNTKTYLLTLLLAIASTTYAMERAVEESQKQHCPAHERLSIAELSKAVQEKDFDRYFALISKESVEKQKFWCNASLDRITGKKAMHFAAQQDDVQVLKKLMEMGAFVNTPDYTQKTPLLYAAENGHLEALLFFLKNGANGLEQDLEGTTALHCAAARDDVPMITMLAKDFHLDVNGANRQKEFSLYNTPLHRAAQKGHIHAIQALMNNGANEKTVNIHGATALHAAAQQGHIAAIVSLIKDHGFDPNARDNDGETPLFYAVKDGSYEACKTLIKNGARIDATDERYNSIFHVAVMHHKAPLIASLINDNCLSPNQIDTYLNADGESPLGIATQTGDCLAQLALRCAGAQLTNREKEKYKDLDFCLKTLKTDSDKQTQLEALSHSSLAPWDPNSRDQDFSTPLIVAAKHGCHRCSKILLKDKRTDPNLQDKNGRTALHSALLHWGPKVSSQSLVAICSYLLNLRQIRLDLRDKDGKTTQDILVKKMEEYKNYVGLTLLKEVKKHFDLRKMRIQLYLSLKNARCREQCKEKICPHVIHLPADVCLKIAGMLTEESLS